MALKIIETAKKIVGSDKKPNTPEEEKLVKIIKDFQENAESARTSSRGDSLYSVETEREDEYKLWKGGGEQWSTRIAPRSKAARKIRPNSEDNFIFTAIENIVSNIATNTPEATFEGTGEDDLEIAEKLTYMSRFNDKRNNFRAMWKQFVRDFVGYGPVIGGVIWDNEWMGGTGPDRWIGDVRILRMHWKDIYFDPAIVNLEERLQECSLINRKFRKKLSYFKNRWEVKGQYVQEEGNTDDMQYEGSDPQQAYLIESWHKGKPHFIPDEWKKEFERNAQELLPPSTTVDEYKAQDYKDMAAGILDGVHVAYMANGVFLEYIPYIYDDGLYPFVYKVLYTDENSPDGFGEIRNIKIPQVMHNKADEIEIEAMSREGLGGMYHSKGAVSPKQKADILANNGKGGIWQEVDNINGLKEREGARVPSNIITYKEHKQRMIETISQNTPIQQGMSPGANMPYKAIAELGARTDVRTKYKVEILEDFLIEMNKLRLNRFAQFYTEDRYYRLKGQNNKPITGTLNRDELYQSWDREPISINPETGEPIPAKTERYIPEFDVTVKIMDEKPTDRNYYTQTAFNLVGMNGITIDDLWYVLEEGKFPPKDEVIKHLQSKDMAMQIAGALNQMPPEAQQVLMSNIQNMFQQVMISMQQPMQGGGNNGQMKG